MGNANKNPILEDDEGGDTAAARTLKVNNVNPDTRLGMINKLVQTASGMSKTDLASWMDQALALIGHEADGIPDGTAERNVASVMAKGAMKEDIQNLFGADKQLTEEFKLKTATLFESAVSARVIIETEKLQEEYEKKLDEAAGSIQETVLDKVNKYLDYVVNEWMEKNTLAVERGIKNQITENFIDGIKKLFSENYVEMPEERTNLIDEAYDKIEELENKCNSFISENIELNNKVKTLRKEKLFTELSNGLAASQIEKLKTLTEDFSFDDEAEYKQKVNIIKEKHFSGSKSLDKNTKIGSRLISEEKLPDDGTTEKFVSPEIRRYVDSISRSTRK